MSDSKNLIISTALKLFLQQSYHQVTMQDIVKATGLSKGAFYHYFSSKEKVFEEVIEYYFSNSPDEIYKKFDQNTLKGFCKSYVDNVSERILKYNCEECPGGLLRANKFALIFDAMKLLPVFNERQIERKKTEFNYWLAMIEKARENGEISTSLSNQEIAKLFIYQYYGTSIYYISRTQVNDLIAEIKEQIEVIYNMIKS